MRMPIDYAENADEDIILKKAEQKIMNDSVNHPSHYTQGGIECLDAIEASMSQKEFQAYLKGNIIKYLWRYEFKNGLEDVKKAQFYLNRMIESIEKEV